MHTINIIFFCPLFLALQASVAYSSSSNFIVAITLKTVENVNNTPSNSVSHMTCFEDESLLLTKDHCCLELSQRLNELCEKKLVLNAFCEEDIIEKSSQDIIEKSSQFYQHCTSTIASVPHIKMLKSYSNEGKSVPIPRYYMYFPDETGTPHANRFHQQVTKRSTPLLNKIEPVYSPFHVSSDSMWDEPYRKKAPVGTVTSTLSNDGGMHRSYKHEVSVKQLDEQLGKNLFGNIEILLPISEGFFIDLDAPFKEETENACGFRFAVDDTGNNQTMQEGQLSDKAKCKVDVIFPADSNIDIEQPSFVSPQHVVLLNVSFELTTYEVPIFLEMDFTTMLHLRYPHPILKHEEVNKSGVLSAQVPPAYFFRGSIHSGHDKDKYGCSENSSLSMTIIPKLDDEQWKQNRLSLDIAVGKDDHYAMVVIVTFFISAIASTSMLRDLSKAAVWY